MHRSGQLTRAQHPAAAAVSAVSAVSARLGVAGSSRTRGLSAPSRSSAQRMGPGGKRLGHVERDLCDRAAALSVPPALSASARGAHQRRRRARRDRGGAGRRHLAEEGQRGLVVHCKQLVRRPHLRQGARINHATPRSGGDTRGKRNQYESIKSLAGARAARRDLRPRLGRP